MNKVLEQVKEFHKTFNYPINIKPTLEDKFQQDLRVRLIQEELDELKEAIIKKDIVKVADALGDLLYVVYGAAITFGIDIGIVFDEIHRSNMTKVGGYKRNDGKWIKPSTYTPPNIKGIIDYQMNK